ncbi:hypothetical protein ZIOFF_056279 [Zingiber officinale]|uniref:DUF7797 domain-containing protein n=1 Tax=Zingiber officinale TaxID=94328 RepID=A0A8J5KSS0_ZINOF|nr:hypothetical protein ZIOFF_056279 [Zingiber officinale]
MVLSALGQMRGGKEPAAAEKALVTKAKERLVVMCEAVKPKDLVSTEAVRVVAEDLRLNRSKDPALGFQPPRMSIAEKLMLTKKKMEVSKETNVHSSIHSSQQLPDKSPMPTSSGGFHNSSTISHVPVLAWAAPNLKQSLISDAQADVNTIKHSSSSRDKALPSAHNGLNARPSGPSYLTQYQAENPPQKIPTISSMQSPSVAAVPRFSQPNKLLDHTSIRSEDTESLLVCDAFEKGNHLKCLQSYGNKDIPKAEWHCPSCLASSNGKTLPPKYGRVTRAPVPAPRAAPNTSINVASKKTEDLDPNTSRRKALANNNSYMSQHSNSLNLRGNHYDTMVIGAEMDSRTNGVKRDNEKCDAVGDHLEETNGSVCANSDASCGHLYRKMQEKMLLQDFRLVDPVLMDL